MDITGEKYGRWTVLNRSPENKRKWVCKCSCGTVKTVHESNLRSGYSKSCGCLASETTTKRNMSHGGAHTRLYQVWSNMRRRCSDPKNNRYQNYGDRGIRVCEEWEHFENFREWAYATGYDDKAPYGVCTIERINTDGNYEPSNCTWKSIKEQCSNRTSNILITYNGKTLTATEWEKELHFSKDRVCMRIRRGWTPIEAVSIPIGGKRGNARANIQVH